MKRRYVGGSGVEETKKDPDDIVATQGTQSNQPGTFLMNLPDLVKDNISDFITRDELVDVSSYLSHAHTKEWAHVTFRATTLTGRRLEDIALPRLLKKHGHHRQDLTVYVHEHFIQEPIHLVKHLRRALCAGEFKNLTDLSVISTYAHRRGFPMFFITKVIL